jgi:hypothetical protein
MRFRRRKADQYRPGRRRYQSTTPTPNTQFDKLPLEARLSPYPFDRDAASLWLTLRFDPAVYPALKDSKVRLTGHTAVSLVALWTPEDGRQFRSRLGDCGNPTNGPQASWLSPLDRGKIFFNLSDPQYRRHPISMEAPMEHLANARIAITPEFATEYSMVNFDFSDLPLSKYWIEPRTVR